MEYHGFDLKIMFHEEAISQMPDVYTDGRNLREGYTRAAGIQFGNIVQLFNEDRILNKATGIAKMLTSALDDVRLSSLYEIIRYHLPALGAGNIAEFGVHKGGSALFMAALAKEYLPGVKVYCFDSFEGMPESSGNDLHKKGDFNDPENLLIDAAKFHGLDNIVVVKGFFKDTMDQVPDNLILAHFDGDLYQSVVDCYEGAVGHMKPHGYMVFDDAMVSSCLGAFDAVAKYAIRRDGRLPEQVWPHMVFRA